MKITIRILLMLLSLTLPVAPSVQAQDQDTILVHQLRLHQTVVTTDIASPQKAETPVEVLEQLANLFNSERGLAISDSTSIILLCNQTNPLDDPDYQKASLDNLGVGLKIRF